MSAVFFVVGFLTLLGVCSYGFNYVRAKPALPPAKVWILTTNWGEDDKVIQWTWYPTLADARTACESLNEVYKPLRTFWVQNEQSTFQETVSEAWRAILTNDAFNPISSAPIRVVGPRPVPVIVPSKRYTIWMPVDGTRHGMPMASFDNREEALKALQERYIGGTLV